MHWSLLLLIGALVTAAFAFPVYMAALLHGLPRALGAIALPVVGLAVLWAFLAWANRDVVNGDRIYSWHIIGGWWAILWLWLPISTLAMLLGLWRRRVEIARYRAEARSVDPID